MHYRLSELQLTSIKNVPVGAVARYVAHHGLDKFIRLADAEDGQTRILVLDGEYAFLAIKWKNDDDVVQVICEADDLRIKPGLPSEAVDHRNPGVLVVVEDGAYISCERPKNTHSFEHPKMNIATWTEHAGKHHPSLLYPNWELGFLDAKHEFQVVFDKTK